MKMHWCKNTYFTIVILFDIIFLNNIVEETSKSIYDVLENNKNIIWKPTDTKVKTETIPVIENKKLKPEILDNKEESDIIFPELESKKGGILWKETL